MRHLDADCGSAAIALAAGVAVVMLLAIALIVRPASQHTGGYGAEGDHDGTADVYDPGDPIPSAARFLQAHGTPVTFRPRCSRATTPVPTSATS